MNINRKEPGFFQPIKTDRVDRSAGQVVHVRVYGMVGGALLGGKP